MKTLIRVFSIASCWILLFALPAAAGERILYKSVLPNGRVLYADEPVGGAKSVEKIRVEPQSPNTADAEAARRSLALSREQLLRDGAARDARLLTLENLIDQQYVRLKEAHAQRERGALVEEGDRQGRRRTPQYFERQRRLESDVQQENGRLEALLRERAQLRY